MLVRHELLKLYCSTQQVRCKFVIFLIGVEFLRVIFCLFFFFKKKNEASIDDHNWVKLLSEEKIDEVS